MDPAATLPGIVEQLLRQRTARCLRLALDLPKYAFFGGRANISKKIGKGIYTSTADANITYHI
jgi:hypothetical protein